MKVQSYKDLIVWQKAVNLVLEIYKFTEILPRDEKFGLISQIKRAAVSIPSNIAEGRLRGTRRDFAQFLRIAFGSGAELETQLEISKRLGFGADIDYNKLEVALEEIMKILNVMIRKLTITES